MPQAVRAEPHSVPRLGGRDSSHRRRCFEARWEPPAPASAGRAPLSAEFCATFGGAQLQPSSSLLRGAVGTPVPASAGGAPLSAKCGAKEVKLPASLMRGVLGAPAATGCASGCAGGVWLCCGSAGIGRETGLLRRSRCEAKRSGRGGGPLAALAPEIGSVATPCLTSLRRRR